MNQTIPNGSGQIENVVPESWREIDCKDYPKPVDNEAGTYSLAYSEAYA